MPASRSPLVLLLLFCALAACLNPIPAHGQEQNPPQGAEPVALIVALPREGAPQEGVRKFLDSVMRLELQRQGLQTLLFASTDEQALVRDLLEGRTRDFAGLLAGLVEFAASGGQDFLLLAGYTQEGDMVQVDFGVADARRATVLGTVSVRAPIDFRLDDAMIRALRQLLPMAEGRIAEVRRAAQNARAASEAARVAAAQAAGQREEEAKVVEPEALPAPVPPAEVTERFRGTRSRFRRLELSLGFAPFIPLGEANATLGLGFAPFLYADYRLPTASGILAIGLYSGVNVFTADESGLASYFRYVVPVGADVRFSGPEALRLGMFVRGGLGAGINVSSFDKLPAELRDDLGRVYPYVYGGIGARLAFSEGVGLAMDVLYHTYAYFWQEGSGGRLNAEWIMGFVPSLYLFTRL